MLTTLLASLGEWLMPLLMPLLEPALVHIAAKWFGARAVSPEFQAKSSATMSAWVDAQAIDATPEAKQNAAKAMLDLIRSTRTL